MSGRQHPFAPDWDPRKSALAQAGRDLDAAIFRAERYGEDLVFEPETDPRDVEWWNPSSPDFEVAFADEATEEEL